MIASAAAELARENVRNLRPGCRGNCVQSAIFRRVVSCYCELIFFTFDFTALPVWGRWMAMRGPLLHNILQACVQRGTLKFGTRFNQLLDLCFNLGGGQVCDIDLALLQVICAQL